MTLRRVLVAVVVAVAMMAVSLVLGRYGAYLVHADRDRCHRGFVTEFTNRVLRAD